MPRPPRFVIPGCFYHITQRGNNKLDTFYDDRDRRRYLYLFEEYRSKFAVEIFAYCLMDNHVHFVARAPEAGFARLFNIIQMRYAQYFNDRYEKVGHVWQGRYYSCILDDIHLFNALKYVERNPVRKIVVQKARDWPWSSAREHLGQEKGIIKLSDMNEVLNIGDWQEFLAEPEREDDLSAIRQATRSGRVWGSTVFIESLERKYGINLSRPQRGRPKKEIGSAPIY